MNYRKDKRVLTVSAMLVASLAIVTHGHDLSAPQVDYAAVFKQYNPVSGGLRAAKTDQERQAAVARMAAFAAPFVDVTERHPRDPVALDALRQAIQIVVSTDSAALQTWEMNVSNFATGCSDDSAARCVSLVLRDHVGSAQLGPVLDRMRYTYRLEFDECLQTVLEKNPHREVRGLACLAQAQYLSDKLRMLQLVEDRGELVECFEIVFGKSYLPALRKLGEANLAGRIESLLVRASSEFADVKCRSSTVGELAATELYEIRFLGVGKVAPDAQGLDQDGLEFKLSDYRGKVVLLYFWLEY